MASLDLGDMLPLGLLDDDASSDGEMEDLRHLSPSNELVSPPPSGGSLVPEGTPSLGSIGHYAGTCRPCAWEPKPGGCSKGSTCEFCHLCDEGELKKRRKERLVAMKATRIKKKLERTKHIKAKAAPLPPGPIGEMSNALPRGRVLLDKVSKQEISKNEPVKYPEMIPETILGSAQGQASKDKDSEDDTASTAASSDKEAPYIPATNGQTSLDFVVPMPVMLCRDPKGMLYMAPARQAMLASQTRAPDQITAEFRRVELGEASADEVDAFDLQ